MLQRGRSEFGAEIGGLGDGGDGGFSCFNGAAPNSERKCRVLGDSDPAEGYRFNGAAPNSERKCLGGGTFARSGGQLQRGRSEFGAEINIRLFDALFPLRCFNGAAPNSERKWR